MYDTTSQGYLNTFVEQYFVTALWSSTDDNDEPLDGLYEVSDIAPEDQDNATEECLDFISHNSKDLERYGDAGQAGHDFWLTRNGHGAGFWGRGLGDLGDRLTEASKPYGESYLYLGDDGLIHIE